MTILITGSSSYIGKNLIEKLNKKKSKFIGIDLKKNKSANSFKIDITKKNELKFLKQYNIKSIIHLAAISNEKDGNKNPEKTFNVNVIGTLNILNFAISQKIPKIIFASTEWVYENSKRKKHSYKDKLDYYSIKDFYASSKYLGEQIIRNQNMVKYCILRFGIIYGKRKKNLTAVESIVNYISKNNIIKIGSKKTMRSFIHIDDIVDAIFKSLKFKQNCISDIQGPEKVNLKKIIDLTSRLKKKKIKIIELNPKKPSIRNVEISKSIGNVKWKPYIDIKTGIKQILNEHI